MKKLVCLLALFVALVLPASAQLKFGVTGGLNLTKLNVSNNHGMFDSDNRAGWFLGPKIQFTVPVVNLGFDAALTYSQYRINSQIQTGEGSNDITLTNSSDTYKSIEIPVNIRYTYGIGEIAGVYLSTGPQFGFNIGNRTFKQTIGEYKMNDSNFSWNIGLGAALFDHLQVGVGYNIQLGKIGDWKATGSANGALDNLSKKVRSNSWQVQASYLF